MSKTREVSLLLLAGTLAGCGADGGTASSAVVRDSAGIRIVENPEAAPSGLEWSFSELPLVVISVAKGPLKAQNCSECVTRHA